MIGYLPPSPAQSQASLFRNATAETGLQFQHFTGATGKYFMPEIMGSGCALFDYDCDGDLDVFLVQGTLRDDKKTLRDASFPPPPNWKPGHRLFRNDGPGKFTDVTQASGLGAVQGPRLGLTCTDFNQDGWPDIFIANDGAANLLWINQGNGTFAETGLLAGVAFAMDGKARAGMGATAGDFDNDGDQDLLVTNLTREGFTLFRNNGKGNFHDASDALNITKLSFLSTGFGVGRFDYDNDGWLDLYAANGSVTIMAKLKGAPYPFHQPNQLFHNEGTAAGFREITAREDATLKLSEVSRGLAFGDVDNDGDLDLLVSNNNGPVRLLLNEANARRHWLAVRLEGVKDNRDGLGVLVTLQVRGGESLVRQARSDSSYLSASDSRVYFGLGKATAIESVTVRWQNGGTERWSVSKTDQQITLRQQTGQQLTK